MSKFNRLAKTAAMTGLATMALASCASSGKAMKDNNASQATKTENMNDIDNNFLILSDSQRDAIAKGNDFALNLFRKQAGMDSKVVSPLSVAYLMGILANGANGNTQAEIMKTLGMDGVSLQTINETYRAIMNMSGRYDQQTTINIANCMAVNNSISLKDGFKKTIADLYSADVESMDFASGDALKHINGWCSRQTNGMIPKIIDQLDANATAVIMNAIYFNGTWEKKFDKKGTKVEAFHGYTRDIKRVPMMQQNAKFYYASNSDYAAVNLPYGNGSYSMTVILPNEGKSVGDIISKLDAKIFAEIGNSMENCIVDLKLPRFTIETSTLLNKPLSELGAPSMFNPGTADFGNISDTPMFVSAMLQKAKIEVSETGTKAAAVTAAIMLMSALPDKEPRRVQFHADRPFVYAITERNTGAIYFIGEYTGPEE